MRSTPRRIGAAVSAAVIAGAAGAALAGGATAPAVARSSNRAPSSSARGLDVLPFPGTPDAAPGTDVYFPAVSPAQIVAVRVLGSRSGVHAGRLSAQPDDQGTAFSPDRPFATGERVWVTATLRSAKAAAESGAPGARRLRFSFSVARPGRVTPWAQTATPDATRSSSKTHSFVTEPGFHVPWIQRKGKDTDTSSGRIFLSTQNFGQSAAYMVSGKGYLLWWHPTDEAVRVTRVQTYDGHRVITFWQGRYVCPPCGGRGEGVVLNSSYQRIHTVTAGDGYKQQGADFHEFVLGHEGSEGTAFIEIWSPVHANLTSVGGPPNGLVYDWIIQEIDVATNKLIWEWHALDHVPLRYSYAGCCSSTEPYDYFHLNSIQQLPSGNILISARHTWAVYLIDKKTGKIKWELGGKHSSFKMGRGTNFEWQHDATLYGHGILTLFDDGSSPQEEPQSRALEIHLGNHKATLIHAYTHKPPVLANNEGSMQLLPNHNVFVGWGAGNRNPPGAWDHYFSEYAPSGRQIFSDGFLRPIESYRAYRFPWTGHPLWSPAIAVRKTSTRNSYHVYVSWNGATQVARWRVLAKASSAGPFQAMRTVAWSSFETKIPVSTRDTYFQVEALGAKGKLLAHGTSATVRPAR